MIRIACLIGDPAGIGPEITVRMLQGYTADTDVQLVLVGDKPSFERACGVVGADIATRDITAEELKGEAPGADLLFLSVPCEGNELVPFGQVSAVSGKMVYESIKLVLDYINEEIFQGFLFAPFNKEAMKMGGCPFASEFLMFCDYFSVEKVHGEVNILDELWTTRVTSHIAIKDVADFIKRQRIFETITFLDTEMKKMGFEQPKIAVSALNPHGGEHGMFGDEEGNEIAPAVEDAVAAGVYAVGPYPCDTMFLRLEKEQINGIISMYHDQSQVATKLLGFDRGVTLHGGMPVPIATCAHGTAFDIAGKGIATPGALEAAMRIVTKIAKRKAGLEA